MREGVELERIQYLFVVKEYKHIKDMEMGKKSRITFTYANIVSIQIVSALTLFLFQQLVNQPLEVNGRW